LPSPRRPYPYYKVQYFDDRSVTWREKKTGFDSLTEAREYVARALSIRKTRIVLVDEDGYHVVEE
jgi:hypothetical protein